MCRQCTESDKTEVKHIDMEEDSQDCNQSEYTTPFYTSNDQAKASVKCLRTTAKVHYVRNNDIEHIRPIWAAQSMNSKTHQTDCEVDIRAGCNILPVYTRPKNYLVRND